MHRLQKINNHLSGFNNRFIANTSQQNKGKPKIVLGALEYGRRLNKQESDKITKSFLQTHTEIDVAYMYQGGTSETWLGDMVNSGIIPSYKSSISSKAYPKHEFGLTAKGLRIQLETSLKRLNLNSIDIFYLHWPDYNTNMKETLQGVNTLYNEGKFKRFGLSNYSSWEVAEIVYICKTNGYVLPTVYQGMYNGITRGVEDELIPCLRKFGISFYAYNPLAGGLLSGKHIYEQVENKSIEKGGRFSGETGWAKTYRERFWQKSKFDGIELVKKALGKAYGYNNDGSLKVNMVDASLRWLMKHSLLGEGDGVIMGPSKIKYYEQNLVAMECDDDLDRNVVDAFNEAWRMSKGECPLYFRPNTFAVSGGKYEYGKKKN
eukprot:348701_1